MSIQNKIRGIREIWRFDNRWNLVLNRIFFSREPLNIYRLGGIEFVTDHTAGDANGAREVLTSDMYSKFLSKMDLSGGMKVLDVGANNGGFMLMLRSRNVAIKNGVSVELNPETFVRLQFNLGRNFAGNVTARNLAVSGTKRKIAFAAQPDGSVADNIYSDPVAGAHEIDGITFDELYHTEFEGEIIDLCKIDIEGAEFEMVSSGNCEAIRNCRYLLMEIHHSGTRDRSLVIDALDKLGFDEREGEGKHGDSHYVHFFVNRLL